MTDRFVELVGRWHTEARRFEELGQPGAKLMHALADELEREARAWECEELSVEQAARESGYSEDTIRHMVRDGRIPDSRGVRAGKGVEIKVERRHLPRRPRRPEESPADELARLKLM